MSRSDITASDAAARTIKDRNLYEGAIKKGRMHDQSKITYPDGRSHESVSEGAFTGVKTHVLNKITSAEGTVQVVKSAHQIFRRKDGAVYEGFLKGSNFHGQGKLTHPDGRTLEGEFREGRIWHGTGVLTHKDGAVYEGQFTVGKTHGQGKLIYPDGRTLEGEFKEGRLWNGNGAKVFKDGSSFVGEFKGGEWHGQGKLTYPDGRWREGQFQEGRLWNGTEAQANGHIKKQWVEGELAAVGAPAQFTNKQGAVFDGAYLDKTKKHGKGQIKYPDGSVYEGEWLKEKRHGAGRLTSAAGEVFEGVFEKDVPVSGKGILPFKDGGKYEGGLVQGKRHGLAKITNKEGVVEEVEF
eukprot:gene39240-biopygen23878